MAITIKGKTYRNLQEQVEKNKNDIEEIMKGGGKPIEPGSVTTDKLADSSVTTDKISNGAVTGEKIANHSVGLEQLTEGILNNFLLTLKQFDTNYVAHIKYEEIVEGEPQIHLYFDNGYGMSIYKNEIVFYDTANSISVSVSEIFNIKEWYNSLKDDLYYDDDEGKIKITDIYRLVADYITVDNANLGYANISNDLDVVGNTSLHDTAYIKEIAKETGEESIILDDKMEYDSFNRLNVSQFMIILGDNSLSFERQGVAGIITVPSNRNIEEDIKTMIQSDYDMDITDADQLAFLKTELALLYDYLINTESYGNDGNASIDINGNIIIDTNLSSYYSYAWYDSSGKDFSVYISVKPSTSELKMEINNVTDSTNLYKVIYNRNTNTVDPNTYNYDHYPKITFIPIYGIKNTK